MNLQELTALVVALTGLIGALAAILIQLRQTHALVNSRMTELLDTTKLLSQKTGELDGRDQEFSRGREAPIAGARTSKPIELPPTSTPGTGSPPGPSS